MDGHTALTLISKENYDLAVPKAAPAPVPVVETPGGDVLNLVIGFEPTNIKALGTFSFEAMPLRICSASGSNGTAGCPLRTMSKAIAGESK